MSDVDGPLYAERRELKSFPQVEITPAVPKEVSPHSPSRESKPSKCCLLCCKEQSSFDEDLLQVLSESKQKGDTGSDLVSIYQIFKNKKDGCSESGYFRMPQKPLPHESLEAIRRKCKVTKNLPPPEMAIRINNIMQSKTLKPTKISSTDEESHMSEINEMLQCRLSGTIALDDNNASEVGEALIRSQKMISDIQPRILSHLVHDEDVKRMSVTPEHDLSRRRSSFSLRNFDLSIEQNIYETEAMKKHDLLAVTNDSDFINILPTISSLVRSELEVNLEYTQRYIKRLKAVFRNSEMIDQGKNTRSAKDNWMVIMYTTSEDKHNILTEFNCNLVRLILQHHCVAYEERDIALRKQQFKVQLQRKLHSENVIVPFVCARGINVGGVQVIFLMHKMKLINQIFKDYIMPPDLYVEWMYRRYKSKAQLSINVKLAAYPALKQLLSARYRISLTRSDRKIVRAGKEVIKRARLSWQMMSRDTCRQPLLLSFIELKNTIIITYSILNDIYYEYLPGQSKANLRTRCCLLCS